MVSHSDCRPACDDEESHHEDLNGCDHVRESHDVQHRVLRIVWSCSTVQLDCIQGVLLALWYLCLVLVVLYDFEKASEQGLSYEGATKVHLSFDILPNSSMSDGVHLCSYIRIWYFLVLAALDENSEVLVSCGAQIS